MKLQDLKNKFNKKELTRDEYIDNMYLQHLILEEYSDYIRNSAISNIEISKDGVIFSIPSSIGSSNIKLKGVYQDKRTTPFEILNLGNYEAKDSDILYSFIKKDYIIFDIGANIGWYSLNFSSIATEGTIYAFEPIPLTFEILKENINLNCSQNIIINNIALSNIEGVLEFYFNPKETGASSTENIRELSSAERINCMALTLDQFVLKNNLKRIDLIKCDVEGGELNVYKGAHKTLETLQPIIFTEMLRKWAAKFNYHPNDIINLLTNFGYKCFFVNDNKLIELVEMTDAIVDTNFFFLHTDKHKTLFEKYN